jgi:hypothetical protein
LNESPWARNETFTQVVGGIGSGVSGEKEIYNTFYIRFLSARPIREAYTRLQLIQHGYDQSTEEVKKQYAGLIRDRLDVDFGPWIVVAVSFRSNDPNQESRVRKYFTSQTAATLKNRAFLVTERFSQVRLAAYYPPEEEGVGARFVFPREIEGVSVVPIDGSRVVFELTDAPAAIGGGESGNSRSRRSSRRGDDEQEEEEGGLLRSTFPLRGMVLNGDLIL